MTLDLDVITDNFYLNSLNCITVILLFVCYISNRTDISIIFIAFDAFCHHLINEYGWMDGWILTYE